MPLTSTYRQKGASMVEMALVLSLFLALIFAVFEFSLAVFFAVRLSEATREGARYAIVSNPLLPLRNNDDSLIACDDLTSRGDGGFLACDTSLNSLGCDALKNRMARIVPSIKDEFSKVEIRYQCVGTGHSDANNQVYGVTVRVNDMKYTFITPKLFGLPDSLSTITFPSFETTRIGEDLWSPPASN